jgi:hypothetical protein
MEVKPTVEWYPAEWQPKSPMAEEEGEHMCEACKVWQEKELAESE